MQRVAEASVQVGTETIARIERGLCVLLGVGAKDTAADADYLCDKIIALRLFEDEDGKMNLPLREVGGSLLVVSQFTLYGNCRKGNRPSFIEAARPDQAEALYEHFLARAKESGLPIQTGRFQAHMRVRIDNEGPVTVLLSSEERGR